MRRETTKITLTTIARALRMAHADHVTDSEIADETVPGLIIRIRKRSAKWALRCRVHRKQYYFTIGPLLVLSDPDMVRVAAERAKAILREAGDPAPLFESLLQTPPSPTQRPVWRTRPDKSGIGTRPAISSSPPVAPTIDPTRYGPTRARRVLSISPI